MKTGRSQSASGEVFASATSQKREAGGAPNDGATTMIADS
jgi:hypothetical protein